MHNILLGMRTYTLTQFDQVFDYSHNYVSNKLMPAAPLSLTLHHSRDNSSSSCHRLSSASMQPSLINKGVICQDYLRGVCFRTSCKYKHVKDERIPANYVFCHDYQKGRCTRMDCRFIHCSVSDEERFKRTGQIDPHVQQAFFQAKLGLQHKRDIAVGSVPVCRDFVNGVCERTSCKYRHENVDKSSEPDAKRLCKRSFEEEETMSSRSFENETLRKRIIELEDKIDSLEKRILIVVSANEDLVKTNELLEKKLLDTTRSNA